MRKKDLTFLIFSIRSNNTRHNTIIVIERLLLNKEHSIVIFKVTN